MQLNRSLSQLARTPGVLSFKTLWQEWRVFCENPPKGFEKYFKNKKSGEIKLEKKSKNVEETTTPSKSAPSSSSSSSSTTPPSSQKPSSQQWSFGMFGGTRYHYKIVFILFRCIKLKDSVVAMIFHSL